MVQVLIRRRREKDQEAVISVCYIRFAALRGQGHIGHL